MFPKLSSSPHHNNEACHCERKRTGAVLYLMYFLISSKAQVGPQSMLLLTDWYNVKLLNFSPQVNRIHQGSPEKQNERMCVYVCMYVRVCVCNFF